MKVFLIAAVSADGFIAETVDQPADWTSKEDKQLFVNLTKEAGVMVMGSRTYATIGRALPGRKTIVYTRQADQSYDPAVEMTAEHPEALINRLETAGAHAVAICGGSQIYSLFAPYIDELYLTIEPIVFGTGIPLFSSELKLDLALVETKQLNEAAVLLHYRVIKPRD